MILRDYQKKGGEILHTYMKYPHRHPLFAVPTGGGKSLMIADACRIIKEQNRDAKIIILSHVMEILEQNHKAIENHLKRIIGIYSSGVGLKRKSDIMVAGIQSVWRIAEEFKGYTHIIIDEAHSISKDQGTMYGAFFGACKGQRIGYTATPFRLRDGYIYGAGKQFTELAYDLTSKEGFVNLISQGYLCKLLSKGTEMKLDTSGIKIVAGDFSEKEMSGKFDKLSVTNRAIDEIIRRGHDRKKWLIFAIDINHAEHITEALLRKGYLSNVVHSKMGDNRKRVIADYKAGKYRALVNVNVLTTGFDDPSIDLIALLRPTQSPVIHIQTIGRGLRICDGKPNCLILDFAGNISRLGPINDVVIKEKGKGASNVDPVMKECPNCFELVYPSVRICPVCQHEFVFKVNIVGEASDTKVIANGEKEESFYVVNETFYSKVTRAGSPSMVKVTYMCGSKQFNEWLCVEHTGYAKTKADHWIKFRGGNRCNTADEALEICKTLKQPKRIRVVRKGKYPVVEESFFAN